ncbi:TPA: hypothetical protein ACGQ50_000817 [Enterobacter cloacae]
MSKYVYVLSKGTLDPHYTPFELDRYVECRRFIKETPKGLRLEMSYTDKGSMYLHDKYHFFDTKEELLEHIANECNKVAAALEEKKLGYVRLMCEATDAIRELGRK